MGVIAGKHVPRRTMLRGIGRHDGAAVPRRDGAGAHPAGTPSRAPRASIARGWSHRDGARRGRQPRVGRVPASVVAGGRRQRLRSCRRARSARSSRSGSTSTIVSDTDVRNAEAITPARDRRRSLPLERGVPDAGPPQTDRELGRPRRHLARPDLRAALRAGHADPVDAAVHRERGPGRRLRLRLLVRLHRHDQLGLAHRAAADDPRSARWPSTSCSAPAVPPRSARRAGSSTGSVLDFVTGAGRRPEPRLDPSDRRRMDRYLDERPRDRAPHPDGRSAQSSPAKRASCPARLPACPTRSTST